MRILLITSIIALIHSLPAVANDRISLRGFGTMGYTTLLNKTTGEAYDPESMSYYPAETDSYWGINRRARFNRDTRFGLNIDAEIMPNIHFAAQLYGHGASQTSGFVDHFNTEFTLMVLRGEILPNWTLIAGRFPSPLWMISEERFIGFTYPYIRLPSEIVGLTKTGETMEGLSTYYNFHVGNWVIRPRLTFGSYDHLLPFAKNVMIAPDANILFTNVQFEYDNIFFTAGYHLFHGSAGQTFTQEVNEGAIALGIDLVNQIDFRGKNIALGFKAELPYLLLMGEYNSNRTFVYGQKGFMRGIADSRLITGGSYGLIGVPIGRWLPRVTYARHWQTYRLRPDAIESFIQVFVNENPDIPDNQKAAARQALRVRGDRVIRDLYQTEAHQNTINLGLNYQLSFTTVLKLELERVHAPNNGNNTSGLLELKRGSTVDLINFAFEFIF